MRASLIGISTLAVLMMAGCQKEEEGGPGAGKSASGQNPSGRAASLQGLDPDGEKEVFGKAGQAAPPKVAVKKDPAAKASPATPAPGTPPATPPAVPPADDTPPPVTDTPPAAPKTPPTPVSTEPPPAVASAAPKVIELEYDEGVYPYKGKHLRFRDGISVQASTTLCEGTRCHDAGRLIDHKDKTAWCEGAKGKGVGQWIALDLGRKRVVSQIVFSPGYAKDRRRWVTNARPRRVKIVTDEGSFIAKFPQQTDVFRPGQQLDFAVPIIDFPLRLKRAISTKTLRIEIQRVWPGSRYEDMCISEIAVYAK